MANSDYYQILGVKKESSEGEIKKAYRKLALEHHPDKNKGNKTSEDKFKEVTKAYEVLSDQKKKQVYDQYGHTAFEQGAGQDPSRGAGEGGPFGGQQGPFSYTYTQQGGSAGGFDFGGFSDPFDIFEQFFGGGSPFGRTQRRSTYSLSIDFLEAVKGVTKKVTIDGKSQTVKIPAGVDNGQKVRFNAYDVVIEVKSDKRFKREGYDVVTEEEISFPQAALGTDIKVETVQGEVKLKVPSGTQSDTVIRLSKKGIPYVNSSNKGDHYVRVKVIIPKNLSSKQKDLLREFDGAKKKGWF